MANETDGEEGRCPVCGWTYAASREQGCVPGDCSYRPREGTAEYERIKRRRADLAAATRRPAPRSVPPHTPGWNPPVHSAPLFPD